MIVKVQEVIATQTALYIENYELQIVIKYILLFLLYFNQIFYKKHEHNLKYEYEQHSVSIQNHKNSKIITICLSKNCLSKRLCCLKCVTDFHNDHLKDLAEIDSLNLFIQQQSNKQVEFPQSYTHGQSQLIQCLEELQNLVSSLQKSIKKEIENLKESSLQQFLKQQSTNQDQIKFWNHMIQGILQFLDNEDGHLKYKNQKLVSLNVKELKQIQKINKTKEALITIEKSVIKIFKQQQFSNNPIKLEVNQGSVKGVAISSDGAIIATGSDDKTIKLWNANKKELLQTLQYTGAVQEVAISSNNKYLAYGGDGDFSIKLYDLKQNRDYCTLIGHQQQILTIAFSQDEQFIYSGGLDNKLTIWDLNQNKQIQSFETDSIIATIVASSDNKLISCICKNSINIWDLQTKAKLIHQQNPHDTTGYGLCSTNDSSIFISSGSDGLIKFWGLNNLGNNKYSLTMARQIKTASKVIFKVILTSDEQNIISICNQEAKIRIYQIESENLIQEFNYGNKDGQNLNGYISISDDILVSSGEDKNVEIWTRQ